MATRAEDEAWVAQEFQTLYGRAPSTYELNHVVDALQNGTYTRARWDAEAQTGGNPTATVTRIYTEVVGKPPTDPAGVQYYAQRLQSGQITQAQMRAEMSATTAKNRAAQGQTSPQDLGADQSSKESARAYIDDELRSFGLQGLSDWAWGEIQSGASPERVIQDLRKTPEYLQRFKGMALRQQNGLPAISEADYINYETAVRQAMRAAGMPSGFFDSPDDFANFIGKDVSLSEIQSRINDGYLAASQASREVKDQLLGLYGIGQSQLAAYFLDPDKALPLIQRQWMAAQDSGAAVQAGYGSLTRAEAERLASLNVSYAQAQAGFQQLQSASQLFTDLPGEVGGSIDRATQMSAAFANDANAQNVIVRKGEQRVSAGSGANAFAVGNQGVTSLRQEVSR